MSSSLEGLVLFALLWWFSAKLRPSGRGVRPVPAGYGILRFAVEYTREPDGFLGLLALGLSMGQWLSLPMALSGIGLLVWANAQENAS